MARRRDKLTVTEPKTWAAGIPGVAGAMSDSLHEMGPARTLTTLRALNQRSGFDCPGCAWPDREHASTFEFCENGVKAVAAEATGTRVDARVLRAAHRRRTERRRRDFELEAAGPPDRPARLRREASRPLRADRAGTTRSS